MNQLVDLILVMKVFFNNKFRGHYPVGTAALVVADHAQNACDLLNHKLKAEHSLDGDAKVEDMIEVPTTHNQVVILNDGNY